MTLQERRHKLDLSGGELARLIGTTLIRINHIERGRERATAEELRAIAEALGCTEAEVTAGVPSEEEAAESNAALLAVLEGMAACRADAKERGIQRGNGGRGEIECPKCKGRLHYSVAGVNGHLWGRCTTADCLAWME